MRLFTAIDLPEGTLRKVERLLATLRPEGQLSWSPLDNLHITTKFIGSWPQNRLSQVESALALTPLPEPFTVELQGLDWFPNPRQPRVLYLGVPPSESLARLATSLEAQLEPLGIARETRPYTPHLTLARVRLPAPLNRLRQRIEELRHIHLGEVPVISFSLYESQPGSNASVYRKLKEFQLPAVLAAAQT